MILNESKKYFVLRHPIFSYFGLVFFIVWAGSYIVAGTKFSPGTVMRFDDIWPIVLMMFLTPGLVGVTLAYFVDGRSGLRELLTRMRRWRVARHWYAMLLIFPFLILIVQFGLTTLVSPEFFPNFFSMGILVGLCAGFLEEIGWMGFAFPKMKRIFSPLMAGFLLGVLHVLWHLAADYLGASGSRGVYWLPHFLAFCAAMVAMRIILVWVYVNTESLLLAQLMHASSTGFLSILVPLSLTASQDTLFYIIYAVALWIAALFIIFRYGKRLSATV